jgi:hypothetical protein
VDVPLNDKPLVERYKNVDLNHLVRDFYNACKDRNRMAEASEMAVALRYRFQQSANPYENMHLVGTFCQKLKELAALPLGRPTSQQYDALIEKIITERKLIGDDARVKKVFAYLDSERRGAISQRLVAYMNNADTAVVDVAKSLFNGTFSDTVGAWRNKGRYANQDLRGLLDLLAQVDSQVKASSAEGAGMRAITAGIGGNVNEAAGKEVVTPESKQLAPTPSTSDAPPLSEREIAPQHPASSPSPGQQEGSEKEPDAPNYEAPSPPSGQQEAGGEKESGTPPAPSSTSS